jgi:hypothetical protein
MVLSTVMIVTHSNGTNYTSFVIACCTASAVASAFSLVNNVAERFTAAVRILSVLVCAAVTLLRPILTPLLLLLLLLLHGFYCDANHAAGLVHCQVKQYQLQK